ncbi:MAG TPA: methyltransferase, partial [Acidobacteriaceae bacterium]|nr:methyltransferase [Acidobacteriaceae bacterium]
TDTNGNWELAPWALDACIQVAAAIGEPEALYLPMSMERIEVFRSMPETVRSWVRIARLDADNISATILVTALDGSVILQISQLRFRRKSERPQTVPLYRLEWEPAELSADRMAKLANELNASIPDRAAQKDAGDYVALFEQMEALSAAYVCEAFLKLGWPEAERRLSHQELERRWHVSPKHRPLLRRMLEIAKEAGAVVQDGDLCRFLATPRPVAEAQVQSLKQRFPQGSTEISLLRRCGAALADVLTGEIEGRELVFPGGSSDEMEQLYRGSLPAKIYNNMVAEAVVRLAKAKNGAVRILEVGGGTGATTEVVLGSLREVQVVPQEYLFTDISPLLVRRTQERIGTEPFFRAQTFNLEQDAAAQAISGRFDVILAVNVLHATSDIRATLRCLRNLLTGDGHLLITEVIGKQRWSDLTVGLLEEWWRFTDRDLRPDHPALPAGRWKQVLLDEGFADVRAVPATGHGLFAYQELLLAGGVSAERSVIVIGEDELAEKIAVKLRARLVTAADMSSLQQIVADAVVWVAPHQPEAAAGITESATDQVRSLLSTSTAMTNFASALRLYVVTRSAIPVPGHSGSLIDTISAGLATGIASERPELRCTRIEVTGEDPEYDAALIASEVNTDNDEPWISLRKGGRSTTRLAPLEVSPLANVELTGRSGIDTLHYQPATRRELAPDEVRIAVYSTALNFRDVLQASGVVDLQAPMGTDCAGVIVEVGAEVAEFRAGDEVVAIAAGCFSSEVVASSALTVRLPAGLGVAQASAQAVAWLTAEYALCEVGGLK